MKRTRQGRETKDQEHPHARYEFLGLYRGVRECCCFPCAMFLVLMAQEGGAVRPQGSVSAMPELGSGGSKISEWPVPTFAFDLGCP